MRLESIAHSIPAFATSAQRFIRRILSDAFWLTYSITMAFLGCMAVASIATALATFAALVLLTTALTSPIWFPLWHLRARLRNKHLHQQR